MGTHQYTSERRSLRTDNRGHDRGQDRDEMASLCQGSEVKALKSRTEVASVKEGEEELTIKII